MFILEFVIISGYHFWEFGTFKAGYVEHDYAMVVGMLRIEFYYINCPLFTGRVFCFWPNSSTAFELV